MLCKKMELSLHTVQPFSSSFSTKPSRLKDCNTFPRNSVFPFYFESKVGGAKLSIRTTGLPETAASIAVAATVVGAAATLLVKRTKDAEPTEVLLKNCEYCGGSGICPECRGEGFVLKKLSDSSAEKARLAAKNMATRYTARLPK